MGCFSSIGFDGGVDPEIEKILFKLDERITEYQKVFEKEATKVKEKQKKQLANRKKKLQELKQNNQEITEDVIKELNKEELKSKLNY